MTRGEGKQSLELRLNCLDPARLLGARQERLHAVTAFSATLSPGSWVQAGLGMREDAVYRQLASPFEAGQLRAYVATHIDTRYGQREGSLPALANTLVSWLADEPGNCIVYFPSYRYLADCLELLESSAALPLDRRLWVQTREQDERAREALLTTLGEHRNVVAFCILGGVFGEGVDLPGEQLASVVIVGVGLPQVNRDTRQLRDYYDRRCGQGFEYTFLYPGMQKVDQALGRVIRRDEDRGSALLIDSRYRRHAYRVLLPGAWHYVDYRLSPSWSPSLPPEE